MNKLEMTFALMSTFVQYVRFSPYFKNVYFIGQGRMVPEDLCIILPLWIKVYFGHLPWDSVSFIYKHGIFISHYGNIQQ